MVFAERQKHFHKEMNPFLFKTQSHAIVCNLYDRRNVTKSNSRRNLELGNGAIEVLVPGFNARPFKSTRVS